MTDKKLYLTRAQLISELGRCLGCKSKPCMNACPVNCNPQEFIAKAKANDFAGAVEQYRPRARRSLIERQNVFAHYSYPLFRKIAFDFLVSRFA